MRHTTRAVVPTYNCTTTVAAHSGWRGAPFVPRRLETSLLLQVPPLPRPSLHTDRAQRSFPQFPTLLSSRSRVEQEKSDFPEKMLQFGRSRVRSLATRLLQRNASRLATQPGSTLRVSGACPSLIIKTNMETYVAEIDAVGANGAVLAEERVRKWVDVDSGGDLTIAIPDEEHAWITSISVPASFNVSVDMAAQKCDIDLQGWLEGTVELAAGRGNISVGTVRGLLTRATTGDGNVSVKHIEGNLNVVAGADGTVDLGKIMGEEVAVDAGGTVDVRALYAKTLQLAAGGGVRASVLSAEDGQLRLGAGDSNLDSTEGCLRAEVSEGGGDVVVQASASLRSLDVTSKAHNRVVSVNLPEDLRVDAELRTATPALLHVDERVGAVVAASGQGGDGTCVQTVTSAGKGSSSPNGDAEPAACRIRIESVASVELKQQSWLEQRLKAAAASRK